MGFFKRSKDIINSNLNAMLEKAENPEKMIRLMTRELEETITNLKSSMAAKMAAATKAVADEKVLTARVERWTERAQMAVEKGKDDLAREALIEKKKAETDLEVVKKDVAHLYSIIDETKKNILTLEEKLHTVVQKQKVLIQRALHAKERKEVNETLRQASGAKAMFRFDEMEQKIERMEAEADVSGEGLNNFEDEFAKMEAGADIEAELDALKKNIKKKTLSSEK